MARAQCGYSVTNVCAVTNTCTQWCCQGEGLEMLGGSGEIPQQGLHQGTSPSWGGQLVQECPRQCRSSHVWQQSWSGRAPEGKVCPLKSTWHLHPATHPTRAIPFPARPC